MNARSIIFRSYLLDSICEEAYGDNFFSVPGSRGLICQSYTFTYTVNPVVDELISQANTFARIITSKLGYQTKAKRNNYDANDLKNIRDCYIYSYCKTLYYSNLYANSKLTYFAIDDTVFGGHKVLFDLCRRNCIDQYSNEHDVSVTASVSVKDDAVAALSEATGIKEIWSKCVGDKPGDKWFYNKDYEYVIKHIERQYDIVDVKHLNDPCLYDETTFPLGNSCWNSDATVLNYLPGITVSEDFRSMCWGKACFITVDEAARIDEDDPFYRTTKKFNNNKYRMNILDVSSIIGYCDLGGMDDGLSGMTNPGNGNNPWYPRNPYNGSPGTNPEDPNGMGGQGGNPGNNAPCGVSKTEPPNDPSSGPGSINNSKSLQSGKVKAITTNGKTKLLSVKELQSKASKVSKGISRIIYDTARNPRTYSKAVEILNAYDEFQRRYAKREPFVVRIENDNSEKSKESYSTQIDTPFFKVKLDKEQELLEYKEKEREKEKQI